MASKLWEKSVEVNHDVETYTVGLDREMDLYLAPYDVLGSMAHITMLESIGLLSADELKSLLAEMKEIYHEATEGKFVIEEGVEDVHSQVELMLTRRLGDIGKKIHSGRSRNDQVMVDLKLFMRSEIEAVALTTQKLFSTLIAQSNRYKDVIIPGYTHLQVAMPSSFGLWFGAYAESLADDLMVLQAAYRVTNRNPLGSAAGYGSSFPLDRSMTTRLLGFESMNYNVVYAQMGRGKTERTVANALAGIASTVSRLAFDACLFNSQNFGFIKLPDEYTTGSSIMPHKKNPDVFELTRAKCNRLQALPYQITMILNNLPSGYFRDMQLIKEAFLHIRRVEVNPDHGQRDAFGNQGQHRCGERRPIQVYVLRGGSQPPHPRGHAVPRRLQEGWSRHRSRTLRASQGGAPHPRRFYRQPLQRPHRTALCRHPRFVPFRGLSPRHRSIAEIG